METISVEIAGEIVYGQPLHVSHAVVRIPPQLIDEHELVYRVRSVPDFERNDLLIVEPRNTASTGERVLAFRGTKLFVGVWWAKHGLRQLCLPDEVTVQGPFEIVGAVNAIVREP